MLSVLQLLLDTMISDSHSGRRFLFRSRLILACLMLFVWQSCYADLVVTIDRVKPAIVGVGTFQKIRSPSLNFLGTGFVVEDGSHAITNAHVVPELAGGPNRESLVILTGRGERPELRVARVVALDKEYDLALLRFEGAPLPALKLGDADKIKEGQILAFTGFPIGMILGFYPVTHRALIASITPIILPVHNARQLDASKIRQLQRSAYKVFQLDGTAYPGNSGSPLYDPETGEVYGVVNMVFVKSKKESALSNPSGISYAIPGNYIKELLKRNRP